MASKIKVTPQKEEMLEKEDPETSPDSPLSNETEQMKGVAMIRLIPQGALITSLGLCEAPRQMVLEAVLQKLVHTRQHPAERGFRTRTIGCRARPIGGLAPMAIRQDVRVEHGSAPSRSRPERIELRKLVKSRLTKHSRHPPL